jgi:hypothetical protein
LRAKGLRYRDSETSRAILGFVKILNFGSLLASRKLVRSPLHASRCLVLLYFDRGTLTLVALKALSLFTRALANISAGRLDRLLLLIL